ncbi:unnamed protein product, partial [Chrysoparadoxa australica]
LGPWACPRSQCGARNTLGVPPRMRLVLLFGMVCQALSLAGSQDSQALQIVAPVNGTRIMTDYLLVFIQRPPGSTSTVCVNLEPLEGRY